MDERTKAELKRLEKELVKVTGTVRDLDGQVSNLRADVGAVKQTQRTLGHDKEARRIRWSQQVVLAAAIAIFGLAIVVLQQIAS